MASLLKIKIKEGDYISYSVNIQQNDWYPQILVARGFIVL
jgi:hypothetical protein